MAPPQADSPNSAALIVPPFAASRNHSEFRDSWRHQCRSPRPWSAHESVKQLPCKHRWRRPQPSFASEARRFFVLACRQRKHGSPNNPPPNHLPITVAGADPIRGEVDPGKGSARHAVIPPSFTTGRQTSRQPLRYSRRMYKSASGAFGHRISTAFHTSFLPTRNATLPRRFDSVSHPEYSQSQVVEIGRAHV